MTFTRRERFLVAIGGKELAGLEELEEHQLVEGLVDEARRRGGALRVEGGEVVRELVLGEHPLVVELQAVEEVGVAVVVGAEEGVGAEAEAHGGGDAAHVLEDLPEHGVEHPEDLLHLGVELGCGAAEAGLGLVGDHRHVARLGETEEGLGGVELGEVARLADPAHGVLAVDLLPDRGLLAVELLRAPAPGGHRGLLVGDALPEVAHLVDAPQPVHEQAIEVEVELVAKRASTGLLNREKTPWLITSTEKKISWIWWVMAL